MGAGIVSLANFWGHSTTKTTERFYTRLNDEAMHIEINELFSSDTEPLGVKNLKIENKNDLSGYAYA